MDPQFAGDPAFLTRFEFEARAVARLKHPALVAVYDQGSDRNHVFLVMELVDGGTLRELLRERGPMPPHAVAAVVAPVLDALAVAHRAGLVHRDVKPENILISDTGEVKIADFGLVRAAAAATTTSNSVILGTAAYLSPEQVTSGIADTRSDVYSTGVLMFELLTGTTPFTGDTSLSIAYQRIHDDVPRPGSRIPGVPAQFDRLVAEATHREPAHRFADAGEMAAALRSVSEQLELPSYRVPAPRRSAQHQSAQVAPARPQPRLRLPRRYTRTLLRARTLLPRRYWRPAWPRLWQPPRRSARALLPLAVSSTLARSPHKLLVRRRSTATRISTTVPISATTTRGTTIRMLILSRHVVNRDEPP